MYYIITLPVSDQQSITLPVSDQQSITLPVFNQQHITLLHYLSLTNSNLGKFEYVRVLSKLVSCKFVQFKENKKITL